MRDLAMNAVKEEHLAVEETDDSCLFKYFEIVPLATDTDVSCTTECASGDGSSEVKQENLSSVKEERDDVCWFCYIHTHPYNGPFPGLPRLAGTRKVKPVWIVQKQETVSGSSIS